MEQKFKAGDFVVDRTRPTSKLVVMRCVGGLYYCKSSEGVRQKEFAYFERDLKASNPESTSTTLKVK